jgi:hypothetical protein
VIFNDAGVETLVAVSTPQTPDGFAHPNGQSDGRNCSVYDLKSPFLIKLSSAKMLAVIIVRTAKKATGVLYIYSPL